MGNEYIIKNGYAELIINSNKHGLFTVFVDIDEVEKLKKHSWYVLDANKKTFATYIKGKNIKLHRFITSCQNDKVVDHLNHNRLDNRKCNLRICTQKENMNNLLPNSRHGKYIFKERNKYRVQVPKNGKNQHIGMFYTFEEAQNAVLKYIDCLWNAQAV